jgi:protein phosphatase
VTDTLALAPVVAVAERTDPGRDPDKHVNEDACRHVETPFGQLCVVCDGMGGHEGGLEASNAAIDTIVGYLAAAAPRADIPPEARAAELLKEAIVAANAKVFALGRGEAPAARPGSTVVAILVHRTGTEVAHVGDSRCYLVHAGKIRQVTKDHSAVQQMVDAGLLTQDQAASHPEANKITRALGTREDVDVELSQPRIVHALGDVFVLCSDGLSDMVDPEAIERIVTSAPPDVAVQQLVDLANARGGHDNITAVVLRAGEGAVVARPESDALVGIAPLPPGLVSRRPRRARPSIAVIIGVILGLIGVAAVVALTMLATGPSTGKVPSFAAQGIGGYAPRPSASMIPLGVSPEHDPARRTDPSPSPRPRRR